MARLRRRSWAPWFPIQPRRYFGPLFCGESITDFNRKEWHEYLEGLQKEYFP